MNAPRQGVYAALLACSFALHAVLIIQGTMHQLDQTRATQGELLQNQLSADVLPTLAARDTVGLALLLNRYAKRPDVALIQVKDAQGHVLATGGNAPTRGGQLFSQKVMIDGQLSGHVVVSLIEPSRGEVIRYQWLPLLLSLLIHGMLWLLYRVIARPKPQPAPAPAVYSAPVAPQAAAEPAPVVPAPPPAPIHDPLVMWIGFDDPRQLLDTLSPSLAEPYFLLCQTLLEQAIQMLGKLTEGDKPTVEIRQRFNAQGARVGLTGLTHTEQARYAVLLGSLFNVLTEVVYRRHREMKHFALYTRVAIAAEQQDKTATAWAESLLKHAKLRGVTVHLPDQVLTELLRHYPMSNIEHPLDQQMREAMHIDGLSVEQAKLIGDARGRILGGKRDGETH